jgi:hypothetical protein
MMERGFWNFGSTIFEGYSGFIIFLGRGILYYETTQAPLFFDDLDPIS